MPIERRQIVYFFPAKEEIKFQEDYEIEKD